MASIQRTKRNRIWFLCASLLIAGIVGGVAAWPFAKSRYHRWNTQRLVRVASESLAQGDPRHALLSARNALKHSPLDAEATRIMARSLEAIGAPEADQWRALLDTLQPGDAENLLALARTALRNGSIETAEKNVNSLGAEDRNSAAFHAVAGAIAMERHDRVSAASHWAEASRLEPAEKRHRLNFASVRLESRTPGVRAAALESLQEMRGKPATSVEALRLLLADAVRSREAIQTRDLADALIADTRANFSDKLARLAALRTIHDVRSGPYLLELRDAAVSDPGNFYTLLMWMNSKDLSLMVAEWVRWMPQELITKPPVCIAVAEAYLRTGNWEKLEKITGAAKWADLDYMRRAYLSRALEHLGENDDATLEWTGAFSAARGRTDALEHLAKFALQAKWDRRAEEIMWTLAALPQCPRWTVEALWQIACQRGETAKLQKLSSTLVKMDPKGIAARNNYAFLSLLTRSDEGNPHHIVKSLHDENPENAMIASTYGLSLFQQGKTEEAAAIMSALKPEDLRQPQVALYHAIFLIAAGHPEKAGDYLKLSKDWPMLPEEKALLERVKVASRKQETTPETSADANR